MPTYKLVLSLIPYGRGYSFSTTNFNIGAHVTRKSRIEKISDKFGFLFVFSFNF